MRKVKFKVVRVEGNGRRRSVYAEGGYCLDYPKGEIIFAKKDTLGVSVFQTRRDATKFFSSRFKFFGLEIIRVRPIGRGKIVDVISRFTRHPSLNRFYSRRERLFVDVMRPPPGTIFYPAVEVLE